MDSSLDVLTFTATPAGRVRQHPSLGRGPELAVVIPTFEERGNVEELIRRIDVALAGIRWEVVFVDDNSPDGTASLARHIAHADGRIRCIQRIGRRGLATACIEGMMASTAPYLAVMDADLQHDERILGRMFGVLLEGGADLVIGTRYAPGGSVGEWSGTRVAMSRLAARLSDVVCKQHVSDPMSGFFMLRREVLDGCVRRLSGMGYKILLDILASSHEQLRVEEVPYTFRTRFSGESKLDSTALWEYGMLLVDKIVGRWIPVRFLFFVLVGGVGVVVHFGVLTTLLKFGGVTFSSSQAAATVVAMVCNFALNNALTYRDRRLRGLGWFGGLASFVAACSLGAIANVGIASYMFENKTQWAWAAMSGILVGAVWNFATTQLYTWGRPGRP